MSTVAVGFTTKLIPNWRELMVPVRAPRNYKDPAKIAAYMEGAEADMEVIARRDPLLTELEEVVLFPEKSEDVALLKYLKSFDVISGIDIFHFLDVALSMELVKDGVLHSHWARRSSVTRTPFLLPVGSAELVPLIIDPIMALAGPQPTERIPAVITRYKLNVPFRTPSNAKEACQLAVVATAALGL